jgi:N-acetylglucosaminyl-diphospho-decaprenol L-rhamnosyltransferase
VTVPVDGELLDETNRPGDPSGVPLRVVLVHWNQSAACLSTVDRFAGGDTPVRLTVVDNGSNAAEVVALRSGLEQRRAGGTEIDLVELGGNSGFGPGANEGLRRFLADPADGEWVALAPHDVDPAPDCLGAMLAAARTEPMAGLLCADVGDAMSPVIDPYFGGMVVPAADDDAALPRWETVDYPHGTLLMANRRCLEEIGVFDERFFSYCEEADLALRARRAGWRIGLVRGAHVRNVHLGSSVQLVDYLQTRNTLLLVQEMSGWYHVFIRTCITLVQVAAGLVRPARRPLVFHARARLAGLRDFWLRRFGPPPEDMANPTD